MKAVKQNKSYSITKQECKRYAAQGFDILDDNGRIVENASNKTVPYAEYAALLKENAELKAKLNALRPAKSGKKD